MKNLNQNPVEQKRGVILCVKKLMKVVRNKLLTLKKELSIFFSQYQSPPGFTRGPSCLHTQPGEQQFDSLNYGRTLHQTAQSLRQSFSKTSSALYLKGPSGTTQILRAWSLWQLF